MAAVAEENDHFAFETIQLNTASEDREFRRYNDGDEVQRPEIFDDRCRDLLFMARIERIVHGTEEKGGNPTTLIVFRFRFHGINEQRRFKEAVIDVTFRDEQKRNEFDPEVIALWPNGDFTLGEPTGIQVEDTRSQEGGVELGAGASGSDVRGHIVQKWERRQSYKKTDRSRLTGSICLDMEVRKFGRDNAICLTMAENATTCSGLVTDIYAAVLLRRKDDSNFLATLQIKPKAYFTYNVIRELRQLTPFRPGNHPVKFVPGVKFLRSETSTGFLEAKLREEIDQQNLNAIKLDSLAGVLGTTALVVA
ncbi:hypothetical protein F5Y10DRAFT_238614 [Nemania abortiva]|nr:hypothetical protein F5Y10DRAFT_238614 [Nemania abortiva]